MSYCSEYYGSTEKYVLLSSYHLHEHYITGSLLSEIFRPRISVNNVSRRLDVCYSASGSDYTTQTGNIEGYFAMNPVTQEMIWLI